MNNKTIIEQDEYSIKIDKLREKLREAISIIKDARAKSKINTVHFNERRDSFLEDLKQINKPTK